jgi:hypothetical protein
MVDETSSAAAEADLDRGPAGSTGAAAPDAAGRVAIIWLPGLYASPNTAVDAVARRLASALDRRAATATARFGTAEQIEEIDRGKAGKVRRASIVRNDAGEDTPVVDLFELDYAPTLLRPHLQATALRRWLEASWVVVSSLILALGTYRHRRGKNVLEKLQLVFGALWLLMLVGYVWLLFLGVVVAINSLFDLQLGADLGITGGWWDTISQVIGGLLVLALGASATIPAIRARLEQAGAATISGFAYLRVGRQRPALTGKLADLVEHIAEAGRTYRRVDVIANSFGSLIALDTLFPHGAEPEPRLAMVKGLVTIGCPYDAVRAMWPGYAERRRGLDGAPSGWLNVYSPHDVFGSNFRDDGKDEAPDVVVAEGTAGVVHQPTNLVFRAGQASESLTLLDVLVLGGFRAHGRYWGDQEEAENTCFNAIVSELFRDDRLLD